MSEMKLEDALAIVLNFNVKGYLTREELKIVDRARLLVSEHAIAVLGELKDDQDPAED